MTSEQPHGIDDWWSRNPMTYGETHGQARFKDGEVALGSREFFERLDRRFYSWASGLHTDKPFGKIFPFDAYRDRPVLELGCGMGTMASLWARAGARLTAIDLSPRSVEMTTRRFAVMGLEGEIRLADARELDLPDASFDYAYSWGVLHHSPNLAQSIGEMMRVIKPNGRFGIMLYNRQSIFYLFRILFREGFLHYERRFLTPLELASRYTDDAERDGNLHTWPITEQEVRGMLTPFADEISVRRFGTELPALAPHLMPGVASRLPLWALKPWARRFGWSIWFTGRRRSASPRGLCAADLDNAG